MKLILISCCNTKEEGGSIEYHQPSNLEKLVGTSSFQRLMAARYELACILKLAPGPDLGFIKADPALRYMPAYLRYKGVVYQRSRIREKLPKSKPIRVLIVSTLYGLVDAYDDIRNYDLAMDETLPTGQKGFTWWKQRGLGEILCNYVNNLNPVVVHDLLTVNYRKALGSWQDCVNNIEIKPHEYPGEGIGSLSHRGYDLRAFLEDR